MNRFFYFLFSFTSFSSSSFTLPHIFGCNFSSVTQFLKQNKNTFCYLALLVSYCLFIGLFLVFWYWKILSIIGLFLPWDQDWLVIGVWRLRHARNTLSHLTHYLARNTLYHLAHFLICNTLSQFKHYFTEHIISHVTHYLTLNFILPIKSSHT